MSDVTEGAGGDYSTCTNVGSYVAFDGTAH